MIGIFIIAAQMALFCRYYWFGNGNQMAAVGIIGGADGPTSVFLLPNAANDSIFAVMGWSWWWIAGALTVLAAAIALVVLIVMRKKNKRGM